MQFYLILAFTALVHTVDTSAYAARLAGVRTGRLSLANSLYNALAIVSRGANTVAGPLIALMTDLAANTQSADTLLPRYRLILLSATAGTLIAAILIPTVSRVLATGVASYEKRRSLPQVIVNSASVRGLWQIRRGLRKPTLAAVRGSRASPFPRRLLVFSTLVTAAFTVSNFAALYASAQYPPGARTAASLAPLLTGSAVFVNTFIVAPMVALVTDEALKGERPVEDVTYITIWQVGARFVGTLLAQVFLQPMGWVLAELTRVLVQ
jgi:hypothetical protein